MALTDIFAGVKEEFDTLLPWVTWQDGGEHLAENASPPRVVWVPTEDSYGPPEIHEDASYKLAEGARPLLQCDSTIAVHLWGRDRDEAEQLRNTLVVALRRSSAASFKVTRGYWLGPERTMMQGGRVYVLLISFPVPILDVAPSLAAVTAADTSDTAFNPAPGP